MSKQEIEARSQFLWDEMQKLERGNKVDTPEYKEMWQELDELREAYKQFC